VKALLALAKQTVAMHLNDRWIHACGLIAIGFLSLSFYISTLTSAASRIKVLLDFGLGIASLVGIVFAIFLGLSTTHSDLKNKVLYFFLSKPVSRGSFLLGRILGGMFMVFLLYSVMAIALWCAMRLNTSSPMEGFWICVALMAFEGGLTFIFAICSALLLSSMALSSLLTVLIVLVGKSNYLLNEMSEKASSPALKMLFSVLHDLLPAFQRFNVRAFVAYERSFEVGLLGYGFLYFLGYSFLVYFLATWLFMRKDIP
jgi:Cu-processing system permease protein